MACVLPRIDTGGAALPAGCGSNSAAPCAASHARQLGCAAKAYSGGPSLRTESETANNAVTNGSGYYVHEAEAGAAQLT